MNGALLRAQPSRRGAAGDKAGNWARWYKKNIPPADDLFDDRLRRLRGE